MERSYGPNSPRLKPQIDQIIQILFREVQTVRHFENCKFLMDPSQTAPHQMDSTQVFEFENKKFQEAQKKLHEILNNPDTTFKFQKRYEMSMFNGFDVFSTSFGTSNFDIFSIYLCQYANLIAIKDLLDSGKDYQYIKENNGIVKGHCKEFKKRIVPEPVIKWRNKIAAHYAAADPLGGDNIATIIQSINMSPSYNSPHYFVPGIIMTIDNETSQIPVWSLTKVFEDLQSNWPEKRLIGLLFNTHT